MTLIDESNLLVYLSGGATNADSAASIGGERSATLVGTSLRDLFPDITLEQAAGGVVLHRCIYFVNEDPNELGLQDAMAYIPVSSPSLWTEVDIGLAPEGLNGEAELLADEETPPEDVTFSHPPDYWAVEGYDPPLALPTPLVEGDAVPTWVRLTVTAEAELDQIDYCLIAFVGTTEVSEP